MAESFYWDLNDRTRAFAKRVLPEDAHQHAECHSRRLLSWNPALPEGAHQFRC